LADYRDHYAEIRSAGANVVAVSVDSAAKSEALRRELGLPFPILCDTERRAAKDWGIYNSKERGGIAKPALFVIDRDRTVEHAKIHNVAMRVPASEIVHVLRGTGQREAQRKIYIPRVSDFFRAIRNMLRS
jgi:thioredoxin-dependent peroxiredoxin